MPARFSPKKVPFVFAIFLGAYLLFWVQLIVGKFILPWFGGTPAVWTTCMLFFQVLLLVGYAYAHLLSERASAIVQTWTHCAVLLGAVAQIVCFSVLWSSPITPGPAWKPANPEQPAFEVIKLLVVAVGFPYFALSATGPLMQTWYKRANAGDSPYRLYSVSNLASFLALFCFPILLEPRLPLSSQGRLWSAFYLFFALASAASARVAGKSGRWQATQSHSDSENSHGRESGATAAVIAPSSYLLWFALSSCASVVFLATTNQVCQDIAVVPLLWVLPLGVYLLSFILCFERPRWYARSWFHTAFGLALFAACFLLYDGVHGSILGQVAIYLSVLFIVCMVCHGELVRLKPPELFLTSFYLTVAAGGAFGGIFVGLLAPQIFHGFWEYQVGLCASAALLLCVLLREPESWLYRSRRPAPVLLLAFAAVLPEAAVLARVRFGTAADHFPAFIAGVFAFYVFVNRKQIAPERARTKAAPLCAVGALLVAGLTLTGTGVAQARSAIARYRNFYGTLTVALRDKNDPVRNKVALLHGRITHGFQLRADEFRRAPTAYFSRNSGIGLAIRLAAENAAREGRNLRLGVVGLGIGTISAYAKPGDSVRFYEINPKVVEIAANPAYFTFLSDSPATIRIVPGDARLSLENEAARSELQHFDVLAIDAFSGDSIPVHLATSEAIQLYQRHLRYPDGILAFHITNTYLDLRPVLLSVGESFRLNAVWVHEADDGLISTESDWILMSRAQLSVRGDNSQVADLRGLHLAAIRPWTDEYSNLLQILRR